MLKIKDNVDLKELEKYTLQKDKEIERLNNIINKQKEVLDKIKEIIKEPDKYGFDEDGYDDSYYDMIYTERIKELLEEVE